MMQTFRCLSPQAGRWPPRRFFRCVISRSNISTWLRGGEQMGSAEEKDKPSTTLPGTVQKIIKPIDPDAEDTAEISIEKAEDLYREIRVENTLKDENGEKVGLKEGSPVDVTIEADLASGLLRASRRARRRRPFSEAGKVP